jgi:hypothetical protein
MVVEPSGAKPNKQRYRWPLVAGGVVVLAILLAIIWMSFEIRRTKRIRDANAPEQTNHAREL